MVQLKQDGLKCELKLVVTKDIVAQKRKEKLTKLRKEMKLPGFRAQQVPEVVIENRYGKRLSIDVIDEVMQEAVQSALKEHNLTPASRPDRSDEELEMGKDLKITLKFECMPQFTLIPHEEIDFKKPKCEISAADVKDYINEMVEQFPNWETHKDKAKKGDQVAFEYTYKIGKDKSQDEVKHLTVVIGDDHYSDFDKKLTGLKADEEKTFSIKFKDDFHQKDWAGKKVDFSIKVNSVATKAEGKYDEAFIEKVMGGKKTKKEFEAEIEKYLKSQAESMIKQVGMKNLEEAISKAYDFELPETILKREVEARANRLEEKEKERILKLKPNSKDPVYVSARSSVRLGILSAKISDEENMIVSENELADYILSFAQNQQDVQGFFKWFVEDKERVYEAKNRLRQQKALDLLFSKAKEEKDSLVFKKLQELTKES